MTPEQIRELAQAIASEQLQVGWLFYLLWVGITIVAAAVGAGFGAYLKKRGENYATRVDFDHLIEQLRKTTEAAEGVRTDIAHNDWSAREWKTLQRIKGEELLVESENSKQRFISASLNCLFVGLDVNSAMNADLGARVAMLAALYFPEATIPATKYAALLAHGVRIVLDIRGEMEAEGVPADRSAVRTRRIGEVPAHIARLNEPLNEIRDIVTKSLRQSFGLPDYQQDPAQAAAAAAILFDMYEFKSTR